MTVVIDASVALAWHFEDEQCDLAEAAALRAFRDGAVVPQHWLLEVTSGLLKGERRRRTNAGATGAFMSHLADLPLEIDVADQDQVSSLLLPLARAHRLSVYDAAYLDVALRRGVPLATLDEALARAALASGVSLLEEEQL